jgi:hypothetical protein
MGRLGTRTLVIALVALLTGVTAAPASAQSSARTITLQFTPTARAQIAIWIEKPDGTFLSTVALTQAVSVRGIGNRPGATQMNSGYHWPYGRREGVLPVWAHRRAAAPDVPGQFPRIVFQNRPEGWASRYCEDSTPDSYFCLPFTGNTGKSGLDAVSCASPFNSDKGRVLGDGVDPGDADYAEPAVINGQPVMRKLSVTSLYPPRRDVTGCEQHDGDVCTTDTVRSCHDTPDVGWDTVDPVTNQTVHHPGFPDLARAAMPDIDAVTMATPAGDQQASVMYSIPDSWSDGDYVAWLEINTEGDYNGTYNASTYPTPLGADWDSWAQSNGYAYRGQPSVVYSVPFTIGTVNEFSGRDPVGYGSVDGLEADAASMHVMDTTITDDPAKSPGSGADRLRMPPGDTDRLHVSVSECKAHEPPATPGGFSVKPVDDPKHSYQWGHIEFVAPASEMKITRYDVRYSKTPIDAGNDTAFIQALPAQASSTTNEALMVPTDGAAGTAVATDFGGLSASTTYWIAVRAVDVCNVAGPHAVATMTTTKVGYTQLSGCFVATAAWGSALAPEVAALRRVRDELRPASALFTAFTELYYRAGPAAAAVIARSDGARALARRLVGPLGAVALARGRL